jgi:hypothetical protein
VPAAPLTAHHIFQAEQRRSRRDDVFFPTTMWSPDLGQIEAQVVNMSCHGFMARVREDLAQGSSIRLRLPEAGTLTASVIWSLGGRVGAEFADPVDSESYLAIIAAMGTAPTGWQFR